MSYYQEISAQDAAQLIATHKNLLLLDARDAHDYKAGRIDGAMQAHSGLIEHIISRGEYDRPVLVYCYQGKTSKDVANILGRAGFATCYSLTGGYVAWKKAQAASPSQALSPSQAPSPPQTLSAQTTQWLTDAGFNPPSVASVLNTFTTPLMLAARQGNLAVVQELIAAGADLEAADADGNTALWAAAFGENVAVLQALIKAGCKINHQNPDGATALIYASSAGKTAVVDALIKAGANVDLKTADDFTALDLAGNVAVLKLLKATAAQLA